METTKKSPSVKKILSIVGNTILWLFVAFAIVITVIVFASNKKSGDDSLPSIGGLAFVSIKSDSMDKSPNKADYDEGGRLEGKKGFKKGSLIFVKLLTDAEKKDLQPGDVITFNFLKDGNRDLNTHRIVERYEDGGTVYYVTQGDHITQPDGVYNAASDGHSESGYVVPDMEVRGQWNGKKIGGLGSMLLFLQTRTGFFVVIILPLIAFFLYELIRFIMVVASLRGKKTEDEIRQKVLEELLRAQQAGQEDAPAATPEPEAPAEAPAPAEEPKE